MRLRRNRGFIWKTLTCHWDFYIFGAQSILSGNMKRFYTLTAILAMFFAVSCGDSSQDKAQGEADAENGAEMLLEEANAAAEEETPEEMEEVVDTIPADSSSMDAEAAPADDSEATETEEAEETEH